MDIDHFMAKDLGLLIDKSKQHVLVAADGAFVRTGIYENTPQGLAEGKFIDIKATDKPDVYREGLIRFDLPPLQAEQVKYARLLASYSNMSAERTFDVYWTDANWCGTSITYREAPAGELIASGINLAGVGMPLDLSGVIRKALARGDKTFSIRIVPVYQEGEGQTRICFTAESKPTIMILDEKPENGYFTKLVSSKEENDNIWNWAKKLVDEWSARHQALPAANESAKRLQPDPSQYTKTNYASSSAANYAYWGISCG